MGIAPVYKTITYLLEEKISVPPKLIDDAFPQRNICRYSGTRILVYPQLWCKAIATPLCQWE